MYKFIIIFSLWIAAGLMFSHSVTGQQTQDTEASLLPDIDPQDIEIRSQYRARFPGLRRQPILGFTPGSRVFQVDPDRTPFFEDFDEIAAQLPVSELTRPDAPDYSFFPYSPPAIGYARLGAGFYWSPEAEIHANYEFSENHWVTGSLSHNSSEGHLEQESGFRYTDFDLGYRGKIGSRTLFGVSGGLNSDFNYLPEADSGLEGLTGRTGRKSYTHASAGARLQHYQNSIEHLDLALDAWYSSIGLNEDPFQFDSELDDWGIEAEAGYTWTGNRIFELYGVHSSVETGQYSFDTGGSFGWHLIEAGGFYQRLFNYSTKVEAALGAVHVSDPLSGSQFYPSPDLRAEHYLTDRLTVSARILGKAEHPRQYNYHSENRFLLPDNFLRHSYHLKGSAEVVLELFTNNKIRVGASYQRSRNYPFYQREMLDANSFSQMAGDSPVINSMFESGHYLIGYDSATIPSAFAGISVDLAEQKLWFDIEGYIQRPSLSSGDTVPFEEQYGFRGAITFLPADRIVFEGWGNLTGPRTSGLDEDVELNAYLMLGARTEVRLTDRIGVYGKVLNLLNQDYEIWKGYRERPFQIYGGITLRF